MLCPAAYQIVPKCQGRHGSPGEMRGGWDNKAGRSPGRVVCSNTDGLETVLLSEGSQVKKEEIKTGTDSRT